MIYLIIMKKHTKSDMKQKVLGYVTIQEKKKTIKKNHHNFEINFKKECEKLREIIFKNNIKLHNYLIKHYNDYKYYSQDYQLTKLAEVYCEVLELESLYNLFQYLKQQNILKKFYIDNNPAWMCSLEHDGLFLIPNKDITETTISQINRYVSNIMGFNVTYKMKSFSDEDINIAILNEFNNKVNK